MNKKAYHSLYHKVKFHECDLTGFVNISNYFKWFEEARFLIAKESRIMEFDEVKENIIFPVTFSECIFGERIKHDTIVNIRTTLNVDAKIRMSFKHTVVFPETNVIIANGMTQVAVMSTIDGRLKTISEDFIERIHKYTETYREVFT